MTDRRWREPRAPVDPASAGSSPLPFPSRVLPMSKRRRRVTWRRRVRESRAILPRGPFVPPPLPQVTRPRRTQGPVSAWPQSRPAPHLCSRDPVTASPAPVFPGPGHGQPRACVPLPGPPASATGNLSRRCQGPSDFLIHFSRTSLLSHTTKCSRSILESAVSPKLAGSARDLSGVWPLLQG